MNPARNELDRIAASAWSAVATDVGRARRQIQSTGAAFVRDNPMLTVAGSAALGVILLRSIVGPKPSREREQRVQAAREKRRARHERAKSSKKSGVMSALGGLVQMWAMEAVTSLLKPSPATEAEDWNTPTRN